MYVIEGVWKGVYCVGGCGIKGCVDWKGYVRVCVVWYRVCDMEGCVV